jgi:hypothetical protein
MTRKDCVLIAETIRLLPSFETFQRDGKLYPTDVVNFSAICHRFADYTRTQVRFGPGESLGERESGPFFFNANSYATGRRRPLQSGYFSIDNRPGSAHCPCVTRNTPHQSPPWKADSD